MAEQRERTTSVSVPELAGLAEVAAILGVSKQRVRELAERENFPPPVARLSGGAIYLKSAIEAFNDHWGRKPGRPGKHQASVSAELTRIPKDATDIAQQVLRMIYHNTRLHDLSRDPLTPPGRTLFHAIKLTQGDFADFEPRYDRSFFRLEPPDRRYAEVHADCCPALATWATESSSP